jgi:hypothetical protein
MNKTLASQSLVELAERAEAARQMGDEAQKAMLLNPCKLTPALDAAVARYLKATEPRQAPCAGGERRRGVPLA